MAQPALVSSFLDFDFDGQERVTWAGQADPTNDDQPAAQAARCCAEADSGAKPGYRPYPTGRRLHAMGHEPCALLG